MIIGIIGAGASGMAAALAAAENPNAEVILMERQQRVGRKLQATGNGRCNLSNMHALTGGYHGDDPSFSKYALETFSPEQTLNYFKKLGLFTVIESSGKVYPYSDQANSVVDILRFSINRPNIKLLTNFEVSRIKTSPDGFYVFSQSDEVFCHRLIVACGGLAGTKLGGSMSGYKLLRSLGHKCTRLRPALVQLKTSWLGVASLKGVRANCRAEIFCDEKMINSSVGEIQFTDYGLSGPVIFEISRDACVQPGEWECRLDFLPEVKEPELYEELLSRKNKAGLNADDLLTGILHNRLGRVITQSVGIRGNCPIDLLRHDELQTVCHAVKCFCVSVDEPMGMDSAQVTAGGIVTDEFDRMTMGSKIVPGLYACGEVLDVDGDCGGFNLQWAWSSGRLAGLNAGKEKE